MTRTHAPGTAAENRAIPRVSPSDDEILGIADSAPKKKYRDFAGGEQAGGAAARGAEANGAGETAQDGAEEPDTSAAGEFREALDANPELKQAWSDAQAYRESFATPEEAREATALLAGLGRMDALFFSPRPEDHAELARAIADIDPKAFASLAQAMANHAGRAANAKGGPSPAALIQDNEMAMGRGLRDNGAMNGAAAGDRPAFTPAQAEFFHSANAAAVQGVLDAIESQAERLLPEGMPRNARNRVVGEIYRELDGTLRANRQLAGQLREAFRSGDLGAEHRRAIVSLIVGRARQALPGVAKRVLGEWTSAVVAANQDRRARQRTAERRVDIAGSGGAGNGGRRPMTPKDIDYRRMSDADILNL